MVVSLIFNVFDYKRKKETEQKLIAKKLMNILTLGRSLDGERHLSPRQPSAEL